MEVRSQKYYFLRLFPRSADRAIEPKPRHGSYRIPAEMIAAE